MRIVLLWVFSFLLRLQDLSERARVPVRFKRIVPPGTLKKATSFQRRLFLVFFLGVSVHQQLYKHSLNLSIKGMGSL